MKNLENLREIGMNISDKLIDYVYEIYDKLKNIFNVNEFEIFPTGMGTIQLENYIDNDNFIEIEISLDKISILEMKDGNEKEYNL